jgi:hypothetical protein
MEFTAPGRGTTGIARPRFSTAAVLEPSRTAPWGTPTDIPQGLPTETWGLVAAPGPVVVDPVRAERGRDRCRIGARNGGAPWRYEGTRRRRGGLRFRLPPRTLTGRPCHGKTRHSPPQNAQNRDTDRVTPGAH